MFFSQVIRLFERGNVCVVGLRGRGKDVLFGNVINRRRKPYVSNLFYGSDEAEFHALDFNKLDLGGNTYKDLVKGDVSFFEYSYPSGSDVYISDVGTYLPSQYCNELNREYPYLPLYFALSRQVSHNNVHFNVQNLNRAWDKIREQSDVYILCRRCIFIFGFVFHFIRIYDKYDSCVSRVQPCRVRTPFFNKEAKIQAQIYRDNFFNIHGTVRNRFLIYRNKSGHDTYYFEKLFKEGNKNKKTVSKKT